MHIQVFPPHLQGTGAFDGGKYVEQRPIAFPGEATAVPRVGPLFYWAWGNAKTKSRVSEHPHQAFEILTYVINGVVEHWDSAGHSQSVGAGGAQVIQAGTGLYHAEGFKGEGEQLFQIWFEPNLRETIRHEPSYKQYNHEEFPLQDGNGYRLKTVIGEGAPLQIVTDAKMYDVEVEAGQEFAFTLEEGRQMAGFVLSGEGVLSIGEKKETVRFKDFFVVTPDAAAAFALRAGEGKLRVVFIDVPVETGYTLYGKR